LKNTVPMVPLRRRSMKKPVSYTTRKYELSTHSHTELLIFKY
jgi:hypothetical protein